MRWLWFYIICWRYRNTPYYDLVETYTLTLKAARRCAYDLNHCAGELGMEASRNGTKLLFDYHQFSHHWQEIFTPEGGKNYRHLLHNKIDMMDLEISRLKRLCEQHNIDHSDDEIPF
ncbi:hypothetical protein GD1_154 [Paraglaciecola Antarctic GD virus 1]|nr:hypothetical protein GD1_154 [Paraglaciecola Antarctic GD virus 1]